MIPPLFIAEIKSMLYAARFYSDTNDGACRYEYVSYRERIYKQTQKMFYCYKNNHKSFVIMKVVERFCVPTSL